MRGYRVSPVRRGSGWVAWRLGVVCGGGVPRSSAPHRGYRVSPVRRKQAWVACRLGVVVGRTFQVPRLRSGKQGRASYGICVGPARGFEGQRRGWGSASCLRVVFERAARRGNYRRISNWGRRCGKAMSLTRQHLCSNIAAGWRRKWWNPPGMAADLLERRRVLRQNGPCAVWLQVEARRVCVLPDRQSNLGRPETAQIAR